MSVTHPTGFTAAGVPAGLKSSGGKPAPPKDMALVVNTGPDHSSASVFTANRCKASPIGWSE
jgi:glutamate N-acetyltransferase/amino-acid N-acetyltransferase